MVGPYREGGPLPLGDLAAEELLAFGALLRLVTIIDRSVDPIEVEALAELAREFGEDAFWEMMDEAEQSDMGPERARELAEAVTRREARELIYACVSEVAFSSAFSNDASRVLVELRALWNIEERKVSATKAR